MRKHTSKFCILRARCNVELKRKLERSARHRGEPVSVLIREALVIYLARHAWTPVLKRSGKAEAMALLSEALGKGLDAMVREQNLQKEQKRKRQEAMSKELRKRLKVRKGHHLILS